MPPKQIKHYQQVGEALLWMLGATARERLHPDVKQAWSEVYDVIAQAMLRLGQESGEQ